MLRTCLCTAVNADKYDNVCHSTSRIKSRFLVSSSTGSRVITRSGPWPSGATRTTAATTTVAPLASLRPFPGLRVRREGCVGSGLGEDSGASSQTRSTIAQRMAAVRRGRNGARPRAPMVGRKAPDLAIFPSHTSLSGGGSMGRAGTPSRATTSPSRPAKRGSMP
jgi:hypothetical protein